ncbi:AAA family ATPase [Xylanibacter muris]|uniref:AAA family ATPase n=1 Tax=Xylanibacter muris TaxID=2736290 RepID=A0ABX2AKS3_9BACT|nr:AAA family ATPase [Xylanibacter muris]NPD91821.1 AAA family ATPase [Xylanibacter muris]
MKKNNTTGAKRATSMPDIIPAYNYPNTVNNFCKTNEDESPMDDDEFERRLNEFIKQECESLKDYISNNDDDRYSEDDTGNEAQDPTTEHSTDIETDDMSAAQRLKAMIGLERVKREIDEACTMAMFMNERKKLGLDKNGENRNHMIFLGNPGTGKTTVAKLIGEMYHEMGLLSIGHTIETNRSKLIGEFIGQTEKNTTEAIEKARGGVLFIDEAYTLIKSEENTKDFGIEVINTLLPVLSEPEPDMIVILAGYDDKMEQLLKANSGLNDRFPVKLHFDDYSSYELTEIACRTLSERNFTLTPDAVSGLRQLMDKACATRDRYFGNGRWVINLIDHGIMKSMAARVMSKPRNGDCRNLFSVIEKTDIEEAEKNMPDNRKIRIATPRRIGFSA